ncbi:hypothetical protein CXP47_23580 [Pseudomonas chlororaphis]|uniref:Uncharacterized protein n=1 Tax=Pseudomonas chlororaphis TaxID=587753 RepID=A0AAQ0AP45_9PSED|nr:hypothetical protein [Pseudomonas chlororaphis]AUG42733.1 hypothetical protein CXP47_23580 [Pseudomonas chlororaphis]QNR46587.1 hypothetical protein HLB40_23410 [Pseudomonas chlororaphis]
MSEIINHSFTPRSRGQWAMGIGLFFSRLADIEKLTHHIRLLLTAASGQSKPTVISLSQLSKSWVNLSFEERLDKLIAESARNERFKDIGPHLSETKRLLDVRNVLTHGTFSIKEGSTPDKPNCCIWSFPEKPSPDPKNARPPREDAVHVEPLDQATTDGLHVIFSLEHFIKDYSEDNGYEVSDLREQRLSIEQNHAQAVLQLNIGSLIVAMGEIEWMTIDIYQKILAPEYEDRSLEPRRRLTGYWLTSTLKAKVDDLLEKLPKTGEHLFMRTVLQEITELIAFRNTLAHSIVRYEISDTGDLQLVVVRHVRSGLEKIPKPEVIAHIKRAMSLSDDLCEAIARVRSQLHRERKIELGWKI